MCTILSIFIHVPIFQDIDYLYQEVVRDHGEVLVQVALPPAGPPLVLNIGEKYSVIKHSISLKRK